MHALPYWRLSGYYLFYFAFIGAFTGNYSILAGSFFACAAYYGTYEYIHWCMHLPKARRVERSWIFHRLNGHHLLHHRYMHKNFNVVCPLADLCMGTLILRSKIAFAQPKGACVPNLQPVRELPSFPRRVGRFFILCLTGVR